VGYEFVLAKQCYERVISGIGDEFALLAFGGTWIEIYLFECHNVPYQFINLILFDYIWFVESCPYLDQGVYMMI